MAQIGRLTLDKMGYSMPVDAPAYQAPPFHYRNAQAISIKFETDLDAALDALPAPLELIEPATANLSFYWYPFTTFGPYHEAILRLYAQHEGKRLTYIHQTFVDTEPPMLAGREIWGFPKKLASPKVAHEGDVVVCTLHYGSVLCVCATMGFKHRELDPAPLLKALARPNFMIKIIPHVDCTPRICELVRYYMEDVTVKGAWAGPAAIQLFDHALCDVARLPVREVVSATHYVTDLTLGLGEVVFDYLKDA